MMVDIKTVLDLIAHVNINRCSYTTYDLSVQECARQEIIRCLAEHHGITYHVVPTNVKTFPVRGSDA
jgi:hypothetical protein